MMQKSQKCYLDSNILVNFQLMFADDHEAAVKCIKSIIDKELIIAISSLSLDEYLHAIILSFRRENKKVTCEELKKYTREIFNLPKLKIINPPVNKNAHYKIIDYIEEFKLRPRDAYHLLTALANKAEYFITFDDDFKQVFEKKTIMSFN